MSLLDKSGDRRPAVVSVTASDSVLTAIEHMRDNHIGFVVVLGDEGKVIGVLTDRDVTVRVVARGSDPRILQVDDVMSKPVVVLESGHDQGEAARRMRRHKVRRLPIVDVTGRPVGVISSDDILRRTGARLSALETSLKREFHNEAMPPSFGEDSPLGKE